MGQNTLHAKTGSDEVRCVESTSSEAAEIERVTALLMQQHPDLERWDAELAFPRNNHSSPAWVAIGGVWVATLMFIGLAIAGVTFLFS